MSQRSVFILTVADAARANLLAWQIGLDPEKRLDTVASPLVPINGPDDAAPTHFFCSGELPEEPRQKLEAAAGQFPDAQWWRFYDDGPEVDTIIASHNPERVGDKLSLEETLSACNLKRQIKYLVNEK